MPNITQAIRTAITARCAPAWLRVRPRAHLRHRRLRLRRYRRQQRLRPGIGRHRGNSTNGGWTLGGGVEYAVTNNIVAKVEGSYVNLDTRDNYAVNGVQGDRRDTEFGVVKAGLNYKFN